MLAMIHRILCCESSSDLYIIVFYTVFRDSFSNQDYFFIIYALISAAIPPFVKNAVHRLLP